MRAGAGARHRRAASLPYLTVAIVVVTAIASLAVDGGRVYVVKAELQVAADSAARYAAAGLVSGGPSQARSNAVAAASDNTADGTGVSLDRARDVELGAWDASNRTFTLLNGSAESSSTAVRVTVRRTAARGNATSLMFARVVGISAVEVSSPLSVVEKLSKLLAARPVRPVPATSSARR